MKADKLHVPEKGAGALSDALAEKFRIRNEKEVLGMASLATDIGLDDMINLGLEPDINPQLMEALDAYPAIVGNQENWDTL